MNQGLNVFHVLISLVLLGLFAFSLIQLKVRKQMEHELRLASSAATESARLKSEFLANMSHEIRTPLNGIIGMAELTLETELDINQRRYVDTINRSSETLLALINDILDFSKIDAGKLDIVPVTFSIRDQIAKGLQALAFKASDKKLEFLYSISEDVPDTLIGDIHRINQIITNFAGNAVKFTDKGEIIINVSLQQMQKNHAIIHFCIADTGIGIPADRIGSIFDEFTQVDGSTCRKYGGTGLGLTITKRLVEMMGGEIWVESAQAKGSRFHFTLNLKVVAVPALKNVIRKSNFEGEQVLIVEDNKAASRYVIDVSRQFGMIPTAVSRAEDAIAILKNAALSGTAYRLVLLDINLGGEMDVYDLAELVVTDYALRNTKIIVISMSQKASDRERFAALGITHFLSKPFSQSDLLDGIQNVFSQQPDNSMATDDMMDRKQVGTPVPKPLRLNILLAEDNLVNQDVAISILSKSGHRVTIANNGEEAFLLNEKEKFDLILMDVQMPVMNGYEATGKIRQSEQPKGTSIPIIGVTANAMKGDREKCIAAGMNDYISKPIRIKELNQVLCNVANAGSDKPDTEAYSPAITIEILLELLQGDTRMLDNIVSMMPAQANTIINKLHEAVLNNDLNEIQFASHTLKGMCLNTGMSGVASTAAKIEMLAYSGEVLKISELIPSLVSEMEASLQVLTLANIQVQQQN